jgi:hypothetical protein
MQSEPVSFYHGFLKNSLLFFFLFFVFISHAEELFIGQVYRQNTDELIFLQTNEFFEYADSTVLIHKYLHPDSSLAALDKVTLQNNTLKRTYTHFFDVEEIGEIKVEGTSVIMNFWKENDRKSKVFDFPEALVVGPLFNKHIIDNWDTLLREEKLYLKLPAPEVMQIATFTFKPVESNYGKKNQIVFKLSPASIILKLFIAPSYFVYDLETKLLQSIHGNTILKTKENGKFTKTTDVDIYYRYY